MQPFLWPPQLNKLIVTISENQYIIQRTEVIQTVSSTCNFVYSNFPLRLSIQTASPKPARYEHTKLKNYFEKLEYGNNDSVEYTYDKQGQAKYADCDIVICNAAIYHYVKNLQDVMSIVDGQSNVIASYNYDPYGNLISDEPTENTVGHLNPIRYRGYVYDTESELYYLQSRYYDPELCRFINADSYASTGQGVLGNNMFAYCRSNPINYIDLLGSRDVGFDHFKSDEIGRELLWHYLFGDGEEFPSESKHSDYLKNNKHLKKQVQAYLFSLAEALAVGESIELDVSIAVIIENGEGIIGYQYLHGTNADVGGFHMKGTITKLDNGDCIFDITYTWNDIMDPNPQYKTDIIKSNFAKWIPFANPTDYTIAISWHDISIGPAGGSSHGNTGYGWLYTHQ